MKTLNDTGPSIDQQVDTLLLQYSNPVAGRYPLSLAVELIFNPVNGSFIQPVHLHLPNKNAEGDGVKGVSKIKVYYIVALLLSA